MSDQDAEITKLLDAAASELKAVSDNPAASDEDRRNAFDHFEDLLLLRAQQASDDFNGRTARLTGLITELTDFTKTVKVKNPIIARLNSLAGIVDKASGL